MTDQMPGISETELAQARETLKANRVINDITDKVKDVDRDTVIKAYKDQFSVAQKRSNELNKTENSEVVSAVFLMTGLMMATGADLSLSTYNKIKQEYEDNLEQYTEVPEPIDMKKPSESGLGVLSGSLTGIFLLASVAVLACGQKIGRKVRGNIKNDIAQVKDNKNTPSTP